MEPTQEDIAQREAMLATHRRSLAHYLQQQAAFGMHIPAYVATSISEARREIERIKDALRGWGVAVEDHPDDSPPAIPPLPLPSLLSAPQQHPEQSATAGHQTGGINFGVGATIQLAMPDVYSKAYTTEDELWQRWKEQGDRYMALGGQIAQLKELAARAGQKWDFSLPAN